MSSYLLSEADVQVLKKVVADFKRRAKNTADYEPDVDASVNQFYLTPSGGIPARILTSGVYSLSGVQCTLMDCYLDGGVLKASAHSPAITRIVYNSTNFAIAGSDLVQTKRLGRFLFVDVGDCI